MRQRNIKGKLRWNSKQGQSGLKETLQCSSINLVLFPFTFLRHIRYTTLWLNGDVSIAVYFFHISAHLSCKNQAHKHTASSQDGLFAAFSRLYICSDGDATWNIITCMRSLCGCIARVFKKKKKKKDSLSCTKKKMITFIIVLLEPNSGK